MGNVPIMINFMIYISDFPKAQIGPESDCWGSSGK